VLREQKDLEGAIAELTSNVQDMGALLKKEPESSVARDRLYRSHGLRAELYNARHLFAEALADNERAIEFCPPEQREFRKMFLALALARAGKHAEAFAQVKALAAPMTAKTPFTFRTHLASVCGVAAAAASHDKTLSESSRVSCSAQYVSFGLDQIREARKTMNYPEWLVQMPEFNANPDLAALRASPDWLSLFKP